MRACECGATLLSWQQDDYLFTQLSRLPALLSSCWNTEAPLALGAERHGPNHRRADGADEDAARRALKGVSLGAFRGCTAPHVPALLPLIEPMGVEEMRTRLAWRAA